MNDIIAKKVNDSYLTRCAQILSSRDSVNRISIQDHGKDRIFFFVKSNGIRMSESKVIPFEDGFDTIGIVRNNKSITMFLVGTNFKIDLFATSEKCYYRNKELGIELKYQNCFLSKEFEVEKNYFQFVGPQKTICTTYALNEASILELCYYYEKIEAKGETVENSIVNDAIAGESDKAIVSHMKMLYNAYMEGNRKEEIDCDESAFYGEELSCTENMDNGSKLEFAISSSIKRVKKEGETIELSRDVHDYYQILYGDALINEEDCFVVSDMFGNMIDTSDEEVDMEDIDEDSFDDEPYDCEEIDDDNDSGSSRFKLARRENNDESQLVNISSAEKEKIIEVISEYVVMRDCEFSDMKSLIQAIINEFKTIEAQIDQEVVAPAPMSDEPNR